MAEENIVSNQLQENNQQEVQNRPVYNPFMGLSSKQFGQLLAGDNPDNPLIETDVYGNIKLHPENVGKAAPAQVNVNKFGQKNVQRTQEQILQEFQKEQQAVADIYGSFAPQFAKGYSKNALPLQILHASGDFVDYAGKSFGSAVMNVANGLLAQKRNIAESEWKAYLSLVDNSDGSVQQAEEIVKQFEDNGLNFQYADISKIQASNKVKDILGNYKSLLEKRHEDDQRMKIAALYDEEEGPYQRFAQNYDLLPEWSKELKGNKNSVVGMLTQLSGDVAGSLAFYYSFGVLTGGSTSGLGRLLRVGSKLGTAMMAASSAVGEYAVFAPSFLNQYNSIRSQALMNGFDIDTANAAGFYAGMIEGSLEMVGFRGFNRLYTRGGYLYNAILKGMVPEALQEGSQALGEDFVTNYFGLTSKDFAEIMKDVGVSMLGGALGGGAMMSGRFRLEGMTVAGLKIVENFNRTIDRHSAADVQAGIAVAKEKIQAENAPGVTPKEPPTDGGAAGAVVAKEKVADEIKAEQPNWMDVFAQKHGKDKTESEQTEINQAEQTEEGTKEVAEAVYEMYNQMKKLATDKVRLRYGKKVSDEQIKRIWNAVSEQVMLQAGGKEISKAFDGQIDRMLAMLDTNNKLAKENAKKTKNLLMKSGFNAQLAEELTSTDWSIHHEAQWKLAENDIVDMFKRNGASENEGKIFANFLKGMFFNTTFLNPQFKVSDLIAAMDNNMANLQRAILHGQDLPDMFKVSFSRIQAKSFNSPQEARSFADNIVYQLTKGKSEETIPYLRKQLFGAEEVNDTQLDNLTATLVQQAEMQSNILKNMPVSGQENLSNEDYMTISLMKAFGVKQSDILAAFGFTYNGEKTPIADYVETAKMLYPELTKDQIDNLNEISKAKKDDSFTKKQIDKLNIAIGFYDGVSGVAIVKESKPGVLLHEAGHLTLSAGIIGGLELDKMGLLPKTSNISIVLNRLAEKMQRNGTRVTDEQLQETVLDALAQFIVKGQTQDAELTGLFERIQKEGFEANKQLSGSLLSSRSEKQRKGGNLSQEQKADVVQTVGGIVENKTEANAILQANDLIATANFENEKAESDSFDTSKQKGQERLDSLKSKVDSFIDLANLENKESAKVFAELLYNAKDLIGLSTFANTIAEKAKTNAFDVMVTEAAKDNGVYDSTYVEDTAAPIMFMAEENGRNKLNSKKEPNPNFHASFREQPKGLVESAKESFSMSDIWEGTKDLAGKYLQSIEGASPNNMARHLLMRQFYMFAQRSQNASELIAKVVKPLDDKLNKLKESDPAEYERKKREFQTGFFSVLADGKKGAYQQSVDFIKNELGDEAANAWSSVCSLIKQLTGTKNNPGWLEQAGVSADLLNFEGDYFPLQVAEWDRLVTEYFGHSKVFNQIEKLKNRIRKHYEDAYGKEMDAETKAKMEVEISNKVNALFQRYQSDENQLSSFQHRQLFNYSSDPEILNYYADPFDTVSKYLDAAYRTIMMRNLFGKVTYDENGKPNMDLSAATPGSLGRYIANLPTGSVSRQAIDNFKQKLAYLAQRDSGSASILDAIRKINQITTLGSVFNAINQVMDLAFAANTFGYANTVAALKDVLAGNGITISDVNAQSSNEVFRMQGEGVLSRIGKTIFKKTGFEWTDIKVKEAILNASTKFFQKGLNSDKNSQAYKDAMYYVDKIWPDNSEMYLSETLSEEEQKKEKELFNNQREMMIASLKAGEDNDYTRFAKWFMLTQTQPINAAAVPAIYNAMGPFGKTCYQFSTVAIRQLEFHIDRLRMRMKTEGPTAAAKEFLKLSMFLALIGLPKELIENLLKGRTTDVAKTIAFSPLHIFMINEYTIAVARRDGLASAAATVTAPSFGVLDNVSRDVMRAITFQSYKGNTFKSVPIFGQFAYWWIFGGREQNLKNKTALFDFSAEEKEQEDNRIASNLNYMETGEDK